MDFWFLLAGWLGGGKPVTQSVESDYCQNPHPKDVQKQERKSGYQSVVVKNL